MRRIILIPLFAILLFTNFTCNKEDAAKKDLPHCIEVQINKPVSEIPFQSLSQQTVDDEVYYRISTGAIAYDGCDYVINANCDTVCTLCGFFMPRECWEKYDEQKWEVIWEK